MARKQKIINVKVKGLNDLKKLKKELDALQKSQTKGQKASKKTQAQWNKANKSLTKASKAIKRNSREVAKNTRQKKRNTAASKKMGGGFLKTAAIMGTVVMAFRAIARVATKAFSTFTDFEFSMAKVRAISGATNSEFQLLTQSAKELGRTTFFTAKEVAELQVNFSKLGFTAEQIMELQGATLDLAMATGSDLARSAMVAGSAVRGFNLDASEAGRVVDVMAVAFTNSALDIEKWQTSMTKVSSIAANMGVDIEGTAAVMGVLADAGIEASIGGTSLRNIFLKMANPTSALAKRIGFVVNSTDDMIKALKKLKNAQLGQLELQGLVDVRQVIAFQRMIDGIDTIEDYTQALRNSNGAGREMSQIMEDSTKGSFKRFTSALEGLFIAFSENIAPAINAATKALTFWIGKMTKATEIKYSETLRKEKIAMNALFDAIRNNNTATKTAVALVKKANRLYGEQLGYELQAIDNGDTLYFSKIQNAEAQRILNEQFEDKIRLQAAEEVMQQAIATDMENQYQLKLKAIEIGTLENEVLVKNQEAQDLGDPTKKIFIEDWEERGQALFEIGFEVAKLKTRIVDLKEAQEEMNKEMGLAPDTIAAARELWLEYGGIIKDLTKVDKVPCPEGQHRDPSTGLCVDSKAVINFAEALAKYQVSITSKFLEDKTTLNENYIADESDRALALLEEKERLAKVELEMYDIKDQNRAKFHLKWVKSMINIEKHKLKEFNKALKLSLNEEKRDINQMFNDGLITDNERKRLEIQAEKDMLDAKLKEYKKYGKEIEKIEDQLAANKQKLNNQEAAETAELKQGLITIASTVANATITILSQQLEREMTLRRRALDDDYNTEIANLDRKLSQKRISQADYDHHKSKAEQELAYQTEEMEREQFRKKKNIDRAQALINGAVAIGKIISQTGIYAPLAIPIAVASLAAQLAIIESTSYYKKGGLVEGPSHEQGGVKFAVGGRVAELEGGEAVINKRSTAMFRPQLSAMNRAGGGVRFADGGLLNMPSFTPSQFTSASIGDRGMGDGGATKVVVVESDITTSQSQVKTIQTNASF